ncbi:MAG: hypothetical protein HY660_17950 [Armatimonadetes bacterium]|nr:hypothetical protein [Armatimonadota bacterium]
MIIVRTWWRTRWRKGQATIDVLKQMDKLIAGNRNSRFMTDLSGEFFTVVWEQEYKSLSDIEAAMTGVMAKPRYGKLMETLGTLVVTGGRELYVLR